MDNQDDAGVRGRVGVVASVSMAPDGRVRLILDDVRRSDSAVDGQVWEKSALYTFHDFDREPFLRGSLEERQLAAIGLAVVARLAAAGET